MIHEQGEDRSIDVLVTVHGIGDQVRGETAQQLVNRCFERRGLPPGVPLGHLVSRQERDAWAGFGSLPGLGFAEVYWADIGRSNEAHVLEDTVSWARTITGRLRVLSLRAGNDAPRAAVLRSVERTIGDLGVTIGAARLLNGALNKVGLGSVPLEQTLVRFLGDVQLFAEFASQRDEIQQRFHATMTAIEAAAAEHDGEVRLHVCAHSQGSVVALLGLLQGWRQQRPWVARVRSLLTIGSPIDKFLLLWPELWNEFFAAPRPRHAGPPIEWLNFADRGDPVGYELDTARLFVAQLDPGLFATAAPTDCIYSRYPVPGKAHVDYWRDQAVFDAWLQRCVPNECKGCAGRPTPALPGDRRSVAAARLVLTFALPAAFAALTAHAFATAVNDQLGVMAVRGSMVVAIAAVVLGSVAVGGFARASRQRLLPALGLLVGVAGGAWIWRYWPGTWTAVALAGVGVTTLLPLLLPSVRAVGGLRTATRFLVLAVATAALLFGAELSAGSSPTAGVLWLLAAGLAWWLATLLWDLAVVWVDYVSGVNHVQYLWQQLQVPVARPAGARPAGGAGRRPEPARVAAKVGAAPGAATATGLWWLDAVAGAPSGAAGSRASP